MTIPKKTPRANTKTAPRATSGKKRAKEVSKKTKTDAELIQWYTQKRIQGFVAIVTITLFIIIIFGGLGWIIDHYAGTKPTFLIILLVVSFPVTQIILHKKLKQIAKN